MIDTDRLLGFLILGGLLCYFVALLFLFSR